jgi:hypothetical protein
MNNRCAGKMAAGGHDTIDAHEKYRSEMRALAELQPLPFTPGSLCTLTHIQGDLFLSRIHFKAHSVAADLGMSRGFAAKYVFKFGRVDRPAYQLGPGNVVPIYMPRWQDRAASTWLHVICKDFSVQKFHHNEALFISSYIKGLQGLAEFCGLYRVQTLAMTAMGCGLDGLPMDWICFQLLKVFRHTQTHIHMYHFD